MKTFKIIVAGVVVGLGAFFYTNPYMMKPILTTLTSLQDTVMNSFGDTKKEVVLQKVKVNTFKIDPKISNKDDYDVDTRIKNMYIELSTAMINRDKEIRQRLLYVQDKNTDEIHARMVELEPFYEKEREKMIQYCQNGSLNCLVEVSLTGNAIVGSDVQMQLQYKLDAQSLAFFNEVHYVEEVSDKWYEARFVSMNEKRNYPKNGKFQKREQSSTMQDDSSHRVEVSHILEGNSNQWMVKF